MVLQRACPVGIFADAGFPGESRAGCEPAQSML
jgi:hypothetical protein